MINVSSGLSKVVMYDALASFPVTGDITVLYIDKATNKLYRWDGSQYVEIT